MPQAVSCPNKGKEPQPTLYKAGYRPKSFITGLFTDNPLHTVLVLTI